MKTNALTYMGPLPLTPQVSVLGALILLALLAAYFAYQRRR